MILNKKAYLKLELNAKHKEDRAASVKKYNKENKTKFINAQELIHKLTMESKSSQEIANILNLTKYSILDNLKRMGVSSDHIQKGTKPKKYVTYLGVTKTLQEWAKEYNISPEALRSRIYLLNWNIADAITKPVDRRIRKNTYRNKEANLAL